MKQLKNILTISLLIIIFSGCSSDDSESQPDGDFGWFAFTINGALKNGEYKIEQTPDYENENYTGGVILPALVPNGDNSGMYSIMMMCNDEHQDLMSIFTFPATEGVYELENFQILANIHGYTPFIADNLTLNVTQLETITVDYHPYPVVKRIRGNFNGTVAAREINNPDAEILYHTIEGDFYAQIHWD